MQIWPPDWRYIRICSTTDIEILKKEKSKIIEDESLVVDQKSSQS